jgi:hypothetical protein
MPNADHRLGEELDWRDNVEDLACIYFVQRASSGSSLTSSFAGVE